jgi:hypothetical protein
MQSNCSHHYRCKICISRSEISNLSYENAISNILSIIIKYPQNQNCNHINCNLIIPHCSLYSVVYSTSAAQEIPAYLGTKVS